MTMWHDSGNQFGPRSKWIEPGRTVEHVDTKRRIKNLLDVSGLTAQLKVIAPRAASRVELLRVHTAAYLDRIDQADKQGGSNIADKGTTFVGDGGYDIACLGAGCTLTAVDAVLSGDVANAYALMRPPGHHAEAERGIGFCIFNNGAIAAAYALEHHGLARVAIVDIDAHHGNGAQAIFWSDPRVLAISIHQDRGLPFSVGETSDQGEGSGLGYNINIPLPAGSSQAAYLETITRVVAPALEAFKPDLIIVPCGLDAGFMDPTARMMLSSDSFRALTAALMACADERCGGKIVFSHEGGYQIHTLPFHALAVFETLSGIRTEVEDPFLAASAYACSAPTQPHERAAIDQAEAAMLAHPPNASGVK